MTRIEDWTVPRRPLHVHGHVPGAGTRHLQPNRGAPREPPLISVPPPGLVAVEIRLVHEAHIGGAALQRDLDDGAARHMTELVVRELHLVPPARFSPVIRSTGVASIMQAADEQPVTPTAVRCHRRG